MISLGEVVFIHCYHWKTRIILIISVNQKIFSIGRSSNRKYILFTYILLLCLHLSEPGQSFCFGRYCTIVEDTCNSVSLNKWLKHACMR